MEFSADELNRKFMAREKFRKMNSRKEPLKQADKIIDCLKMKRKRVSFITEYG